MFLGFKKTKVLAAVIALACMLTYSVSAFAAPTYLTTTQYVTGDATKATVTTTVSGLNDTAYPGEQTTYLATKSDGTILYIWQAAADVGGTVNSGFSFKTDATNADGSGLISVGTMNEGPAAPDTVNTSDNGGATSATFKTTSLNYSVTFAAKLDSDNSVGGAVFTNPNPGSVTPDSTEVNVAYTPVWGWEPVAIQIAGGSKTYLNETTTPTLAEATSNAFTLPASLITGDCTIDIFFAPIAVSNTTTAPAYVIKEAAVGTGEKNAGLVGTSYAGFATAASPAGVSIVKYGILVGTSADLATIDGTNVSAATTGEIGAPITIGSATVYNYPGKALNQFGQFGVKVIDTTSTLPANASVRTYVIYSDGTYQLGSMIN